MEINCSIWSFNQVKDTGARGDDTGADKVNDTSVAGKFVVEVVGMFYQHYMQLMRI